MSLLDFYQQHGISPVRQDITDLPAHFARRAHLYRSLGLPPMAVRDRTVLEVGPGGGENARYTLSLRPQVYVAVEPNPVAREALLALQGPVLIDPRRLEDFASTEGFLFDLVLCEGLLGLSGTDSHALLEQLVRHVAPGGLLVITCIDAISDHAEVLRRAQTQRLLREQKLIGAYLTEQVAVLRPVFAPHLATLTGMTRSVDDWIVDNLLNPASIGPTFSIPDACAQLAGRFEVLGCSPRFLTDWRWYKAQTPGNQWAIDSYWTQAHNLMDYRTVKAARPPGANAMLARQCQRTRETLQAYEAGLGSAPVETLPDPSWFGRGQQYLSFVRV